MRETVTTPAGDVGIAWHRPAKADTYLVVAHGAGGTMETPSIRAYAEAMCARGIGIVRFNFAYTEKKKKAPDRAPVLEETWRAVADVVTKEAGRVLLGGRSMGGRIASHIVAGGYPAAGLVFLAYPLHPPGKPERLRDEHLYEIEVPMLFLQGTKDPFATDPFATPDLLAKVTAKLPAATVHRIEGGDHSHKVSGRKPDDVMEELVGTTVDWIASI
jgi:uncharacterized protein